MPADRTGEWEVPLRESARDPEQVRVALTEWLRPRLGAGALVLTRPEVPRDNGVSNETYMFEARGRSARYALVARVQTDDPLYLEAGVERQYLVQRALADVDGVVVPAVVDYEADRAVVGAAFFVMERVTGVVPSSSPHFSRAGWLHDATPGQREAVWRSAVEQLVALHSVDVDRLPFLERHEAGTTSLDRELAHWRAAYRWAAGREPFPVLDAAETWLLNNAPTDPMSGLSWGDARLENMVFHDHRCAAVLDFETASLAGPASDLAWWALMDKGSEDLRGLGSPQQTIDLYRELAGRGLRDLHYHLVLCAFRLAVIYIRLAALLRARNALDPSKARLAHDNDKMQQLAVLMGLAAPHEVRAHAPRLSLH